MQVNLFEASESGFFSCVRVRPPPTEAFPASAVGTEPEVLVTSPRTVELATRRTNIRTGTTRSGGIDAYSVDGALGCDCSDNEAYATILRPVVRKVVLRGCAATVVAYGQTGSGKTHTVGAFCDRFPVDLFDDLKSGAEALGLDEPLVDVEMTAVEMLGSKCFDLLGNKAPVSILEAADGEVQLQGATVHRLPRWSAQQGAADLAKLLATSQACRASAATHKHDKSSRSHAIYRIILYSRSPSLEAAEAAPAAAHDNSSSSRSSGNDNSNLRVAIGRLTLVDLAGSERGSDRGEKVSKERLAESVAINKSLSALRDCMKASDAFHTGAQAGSGGVARYRQNLLTLVLRDAFAFGDAVTVFVACLSPLKSDGPHSKSTLQYTKGILDRQHEHHTTAGATNGGVNGGSINNDNGELILRGALGDPSQWDKKTVAAFVRLLAEAFDSQEGKNNGSDSSGANSTLGADPSTSGKAKTNFGSKTSKPPKKVGGGVKGGSSDKGAKVGATATKNGAGEEVNEWVGAFRLNGAQLCNLSDADILARVNASPRSQKFATLLASSVALLHSQYEVGGAAALTNQHGGIDVGALASETSRNVEKGNSSCSNIDLKERESGDGSRTFLPASALDLEVPKADQTAVKSPVKSPESIKPARTASEIVVAKCATIGATKTSAGDTVGGETFGRASVAAFERLATLTASMTASDDRIGSSDCSTTSTMASVSAAWSGAVEELAALRDLAAAAKKAFSRQTTRHKAAESRRVNALSSSLSEGRAALAVEHVNLTLLYPAHRRALAHADASKSEKRSPTSGTDNVAPPSPPLPELPPPPPKISLFSWTKGSKKTSAATAMTIKEKETSAECATSSGVVPADAPSLTELTPEEALVLSDEVSSFDAWATLHDSALHATMPSKTPLPPLDCLDRAQEALDTVKANGALSSPVNYTRPDALAAASTAAASALREALACSDAIAARQTAFRSRDAEDKAAEKAFVSTRDELESLAQGTVAAAKARRDDLCDALCTLRDEGSLGDDSSAALLGVCGEEVAALVEQYEATKQSWEDFWNTK